MKLKIISDDPHLSADDRENVSRRLRPVLATSRQAIDTVEVWLCDLPGFESEAIKHCRIEIRLANGQAMIADSCDADGEVVIERAAMRAGRSLAAAGQPRTRSPESTPAPGFGQTGNPAARYLEYSA